MARSTWLIVLTTLFFLRVASALDYTELAAVKLLRGEKRFEEAIQRLDSLAKRATSDSENYHYLQMAMEIATQSLKNSDRALALAQRVRDPARRDHAHLRVLAELKRDEEAIKWIAGRNMEQWPVDCRADGYAMAAEIFQRRGDASSAQDHWLKALAAPGGKPAVRGRAATEGGNLFLQQGNDKKAEELFRKALEISASPYAWRNQSQIALSRLLLKQGRAAEAVQLFDGTDFAKVENVVSRASLLEAYSRALLAAGRKIKAIETFDALLQLGISEAWKERINQELDQLAEEL